MATKKIIAAESEADVATSDNRRDVVVAVAAGLIQSPRFAARLTDERHQNLLVDTAVKIADKIITATK